MDRATVIRLFNECVGRDIGYTDVDPEQIERFAELVAQHEREACATLCEAEARDQQILDGVESKQMATLIRARAGTAGKEWE